MKKLIHFIKYNNATIIILALFFLVGASALATETGQAALGQKQTRIEGVDNSLLIKADLAKIDMDFRIEKISSSAEASEDKGGYYYVTYTYIDLLKLDNSWQYQLQEKVRRVSKKLKVDLGEYLAQELSEEYEKRIKELMQEQAKANHQGEEKRVEVTEYSGLIGKTLDVVAKVIPGYQPVKQVELPSPSLLRLRTPVEKVASGETEEPTVNDEINQIYQDFINENDPDQDNVFGAADNCPTIYNPEQLDQDNDNIGDQCDLTPEGEDKAVTDQEQATSTEEIMSDIEAEGQVEIIDLPAVDTTAGEQGQQEQQAAEEVIKSEEETATSTESQEALAETEPTSEEVVEPEAATGSEVVPEPEVPVEEAPAGEQPAEEAQP